VTVAGSGTIGLLLGRLRNVNAVACQQL